MLDSFKVNTVNLEKFNHHCLHPETWDNASRRCVYSDRTSSERIQLLSLSALDTADTPWCLHFHHSLSKCPKICQKVVVKALSEVKHTYLLRVCFSCLFIFNVIGIVVSHLAPDSESEITVLYSSHVIAACQVSLQAKQKVHPH